jgi:hypothetical protein
MSFISSYRLTTPDSVTSFTVPNLKRPGIEKNFIIKNTSAILGRNVRINFEGDGSTNYITLGPGESTPTLRGLGGGDIVYLDGVSGSVTVEIIMWEG